MSDVPEDLGQTRRTLLERLKNWEDRQAWQEFFDTHWKLIYSVAIKAGLTEAEAREVVQETVITVSHKIKDFKYDPTVGRFRHWLLNVTRWKVAEQFRRRRKEAERALRFHQLPSPASSVREEMLAALAVAPNMEALWDDEWQRHVMDIALRRVKARVNPKHYQIFDFCVLKGWPLLKVATTLRVNLAQVYLTKSRVSKLLEKELQALGKTEDGRNTAAVRRPSA